MSTSVHLKAKLTADIFGTVACQCSQEDGFIQFNSKCHGEQTFTACGSSTQYQLIRVGDDDTDTGMCVKNKCGSGMAMWRIPHCDDQNIYNCFQCKPYDDSVPSCPTKLMLKSDDTLTCDSLLAQNGVLDACPERDSEGDCVFSTFSTPTQNPSDDLIIRSLCNHNRRVMSKVGIPCN